MVRFQVINFKSTPRVQRSAALALQIRQWSPFEQTGRCVVMADEQAWVWIWDATRVGQRMVETGLGKRPAELVPESLLHPVMQEGTRLVSCFDGFEGQVWTDGRLAASFWWPVEPDSLAWQTFLRDAGMTITLSAPGPESLTLTEKPWGTVADLRSGGNGVAYEQVVLLGGTLLLASASFWHLASLYQVQEAVDLQQERLSALEQQARPVQEARREALDLAARVDKLRALAPYPDQAVLFSVVGKLLPKDGTYLKDWDFQNGRLKLTLASPGKLSASNWVKTFQDSGWFKEVQSVSGTETSSLALEMNVLTYDRLSSEIIAGKSEIKPPVDTKQPVASPSKS